MTVAGVREVRVALLDQDYLADDGLATAVFLALELGRPLLLEGEAGVGKTEVAKVLAALARHRAGATPVLRGHRRRPGALRVGLRRASCCTCARPRRPVRRSSRTSCTPSASSSGARSCGRSTTRRPAAGAADRRDRPRRRRVRGVPPRAPVRLRGHRPRARGDPGRGPADRRADLEPHPGRARRAETALPVPLDRPSRLRARGRDPAPQGSRVPSAGLAGQVAGAVERLRGARLYKPPGVAETIDWVNALAASRRGRDSTRRRSRHPGRRPQVPGGPGPGRRGRPAGAGRGGRCRVVPDPATRGPTRRRADGRTGRGRLRPRCCVRAGLRVPVGQQRCSSPRRSAWSGWDAASDVYWAGRATLVRRPEDVGTYDACFGAWFGTAIDADEPVVAVPTEAIVALDLPAADDARRSRRHRRRRAGARRALQPGGGARGTATSRPTRPPSTTRRAGCSPTCAWRVRAAGPVGSRAHRRRTGRPDVRRTVRAALADRRRAGRRAPGGRRR